MQDNCKNCGQPIGWCSWDNDGEWYHVDDYEFSIFCEPDVDSPNEDIAEPT